MHLSVIDNSTCYSKAALKSERMTFPSVFVVGCPRSGTTLLQRMLDHHPLLTVANDSHFIPRVLEKIEPQAVAAAIAGKPIPLTQRLVDGVRDYHRTHRLELDKDCFAQAAAVSDTYASFVTRLYAARAELKGKPQAGEKTPDYVRHLPLLAGLFPGAAVLHIVRDGRDVCLSLLEWATPHKGPGKLALWKTEPVAVAAMWWKWLVRSGLDGRSAVAPGRHVLVCYEALVSDPATALQAAVDAIGLPLTTRCCGFT